MKIIMILFGFFPSDVRVRKEALTLTKAGQKVTVLCCAERNANEFFCTIRVPRVGKPSDWKGKMTPVQLLKFWLLSFTYLLRNRYFDVLHCHDLTGLLPAVWYKLFFPRTKIVYDSHEIYPDAVREKLGRRVGFPFLLLESFCIKFVKCIICISIPQREIMRKRYNVQNFLFLPNYPTSTEFFADKKTSDKKMRIVYSGGIHRNRGYEELVEAVDILRKKRDDFVIQLIGNGPLRHKIKEMVDKQKLGQFIEILGPVHYTKVRDYLNNADIGIALYKLTINSRYGLSNKVFEYIICGLPLIYPFYEGTVSYLRKVGAVRVDPSSPENIAHQIDFLMSRPDLRESIRRKELGLVPQVIWESIEDKLLGLYERINAKKGSQCTHLLETK